MIKLYTGKFAQQRIWICSIESTPSCGEFITNLHSKWGWRDGQWIKQLIPGKQLIRRYSLLTSSYTHIARSSEQQWLSLCQLWRTKSTLRVQYFNNWPNVARSVCWTAIRALIEPSHHKLNTNRTMNKLVCIQTLSLINWFQAN